MSKKLIFVLFALILFILILIYIYSHLIINKNVLIESTGSELNKNQVQVVTKVGAFIGNLVAYNDKDVAVFLGIPYAEPPIGSLRYKRPVPLRELMTKMIANRWPNPCLQRDNHLSLNNYNFSEDCLYMNIWTPSADQVVNQTVKQLKPVLIHIHTGAFMFGSASESTYNGLVLASIGDVIVVTFNYRLNLYGFLYTGTDSVDTNVGMYDQQLAIQWVSQHIANFGGDPTRVTLIGQSTGALSVGFHIISTISSQLFSRAVLLSGSPLEHQWLSEPTAARDLWINYAKDVNCMDSTNSIEKQLINANILKCLLKVNRNQLPSMTDMKRYTIDPFIVSAPVVFDKQFNTKLIERENYNLTKDMSILFGYTDDEGSWMLALEDRHLFGPKSQQNMTFNDTLLKFNEYITKIKSNTEYEIDSKNITNYYLNTISSDRRKDKNLLSRTIGIALGDYYIGCPLHNFVDYLYKNINKSNEIYQYYWTYKGDPKSSSFWRTFEEVWCGKWMGSCHSFELYAIFGIPFQQSIAFNDIDRRLSLKMIKIISNFAYNITLDEKFNKWSKFNQMNDISVKPYRVLNYGISFDDMYGTDLKKYECDLLWKQSVF